jgi:isoquinoline 1-oxidoreductase beta subunit
VPVEAGEVSLNGWIKIGADGTVMLAMNRSEMGQGTHTASPCSSPRSSTWRSRTFASSAGPDRLYGNVATMVPSLPYFHPREREPGRETTPVKAGQWVVAKVARELGINLTGGSSSVVDGWEVLRVAAATARARLLGAASIAWKQPAGELIVRDGVVSHASGGSAHYGELARMAAATPTGEVRLKRREDWKLIGTAAPRIDAAAKSDGSARFGSDVRALFGDPSLPDARRQRARSTRRRSRAGVERVVRLGPYGGSTAALVVGRTHAQRSADAIKVEWRQRPAGRLDTRDVMAHLERGARGGDARRQLRLPQPQRHRERRCRRGAHRADLPRALPRARGDGADQLHGARRRRQGGVWAPRRRPASRGRLRRKPPASTKTPSPSTSRTSAAASDAGSTSTSSARRYASPSRPAADRCSSSGRAKRT